MTETGSINFDVPVARRSAYSKLRALFRRKAIMQTASSYLFPWGIAQSIKDGLDKINQDKDGNPLPSNLHVRYSIFKYDEKESGKAIEQSAKDALGRMLKGMKEQVNKKVHALFTEETATEDKDPITTARASVAKARNTLRDARALALMFNLTDQLEAGFLAYEAFIEAKKEDIGEWEKASSTKKLDAFEASLNVAPVTPAATV